MTTTDELREQIDLVRSELDDIDQQVDDGEMEADVADRLRARYVAELADLEAAVGSRDESPEGAGESEPDFEDLPDRSEGSTFWGVGAVVAGIVVVALLALAGVLGVRAFVGGDDPPDGQIDLASVSNEEMEDVVAANPDIVPMRLALARRYFETGEFDKALDHYFEVLDREQNVEALANVGWMTHLSGRSDIAVDYLEAALAVQPDYLPAKWFIGNVYIALDRSDEAIEPLTEITTADGVPDSIRDEAITILSEIAPEG